MHWFQNFTFLSKQNVRLSLYMYQLYELDPARLSSTVNAMDN
jgi:hypothetical protein